MVTSTRKQFYKRRIAELEKQLAELTTAVATAPRPVLFRKSRRVQLRAFMFALPIFDRKIYCWISQKIYSSFVILRP